MPGNDEGINIGDGAGTFNELATQYWAWKNFDLDYYGFCHYRRFISFGEKQDADIYGNVVFERYDDNIFDLLGYNRFEIEDEIRKYDITLVDGFDTKKVGSNNLYDQYASSEGLYIKDMECAIEILKEKYPEYSHAADLYMNGNIFYPCNMFIMKKKIFFEYCEWLFDILFELEKKIDTSKYSDLSLRMIGHVGERLLGVFVWHQKRLHDYSISVKQRFLIRDMSKFELPVPHCKKDNVPIIFSTDDNFSLYTAAAINSLIQASNSTKNYDIFVLNSGLEKDSMKTILDIAEGHGNVHIEFINVIGFTGKYNLIPNAHISVETFYRLLAPELFVNFNKILYLDADMIILKDVADLFNTDIGDNLLAGVVDSDFLAQYNGLRPEAKLYADEELKLKDPYKYCQAGVLIFNLKEMRKTFKDYELVEAGDDRFYLYGDQDILNLKCQGRIFYLDMAWNVMHDCNKGRMKIIRDYTPRDIADLYFESRKDPYIIHYAGYSKPWNDPNDDYAEVFWKSIRNTNLYERMLYKGCLNKPQKQTPSTSDSNKPRKETLSVIESNKQQDQRLPWTDSINN